MMRLAWTAVACLSAWIGVAVVILPLAFAESWSGGPGEPRTGLLVYLLLQLVLPTLASIWVGRRLGPTIDASTRARLAGVWRWALWPVLVGYGLTAAFGSPAVHNSLTHSMLTAWGVHRIQASCFPELETFLAIPVIPGVVLSYTESQASCEGGGGGFLLHLWTGRDVRRLAMYTVWAAP